MHVYGDAYQRGYAQGAIWADTTVKFTHDELDHYFEVQALDIDFDWLPKWMN